MGKPESIRIRCDGDTKWEWDRFAGPYNDAEDALNALLEAHQENADMTRRNNFDRR